MCKFTWGNLLCVAVVRVSLSKWTAASAHAQIVPETVDNRKQLNGYKYRCCFLGVCVAHTHTLQTQLMFIAARTFGLKTEQN